MFNFLRKSLPAVSAVTSNQTTSVNVSSDAMRAMSVSTVDPGPTAMDKPTPRPDDIAIIGLALRLPQSETLDDFWSQLIAQKSLITEVPEQRWDKKAYYGDPRKQDGKTNSIWGGFVDQADCFDAEFFKISPREAQNMDPQQRFAMELAWKAIEDAGYSASDLAGGNIGVYMGVCHWDYAELFEKTGQTVDAYFPTGTAYSIIANRVSHFFDLTGPSITNDTACASSLVSVYQAVRAIQNGECDAALAGGVNLAWSVNHFIAFGKNGMLSKHGRSRAFDSEADGYVRGEGGAVLLLKPLYKALADGDLVHAVIKGVGTNHGGRTGSLTVTNPNAQARLIRDIYTKSGIAPDSVSYIEAHGPGTPMGDPIEVLGLKTAFHEMHQQAGSAPVVNSCGIGSVKTNIGHLEGAAGVAGMVKVIAAMQKCILPGNVDFKRLNPLINLVDSPFFIVEQTQPWLTKGPTPRRAGVSSFGFGGSNAHVILEEYMQSTNQPAGIDVPVLVPLSARNAERLQTLMMQLAAHLREWPELDIQSLAYTLQVGREAMAERIAFVVSSVSELTTRLEAAIADAYPVNQCWRGNANTVGAITGLLDADEDTRLLIPQWVAKGRLDKLAMLWCQCGALDWRCLYPAHRPARLRLPTYPFARVRHWLPDPAVVPQSSLESAQAAAANLHPLVHNNISTLARQAYRSIFSGLEFFFADHRIADRKVLPGVAYLEMVRAAAALAVGGDARFTLKNVVWTVPLRVAVNAPVSAQVRLTPQAQGDIAYEVTSEVDNETTLHGQGTIVISTDAMPPRLDLAQLQQSCARPMAIEDCYGQLRAAGMVHGPTLQAMSALWLGEHQVLVQLRLPETLHASAGDYQLHPAMLDGAIQGTVALLHGARPALPFALRELQLHAPCSVYMWAWIRYSDAATIGTTMPRFDIDLFDGEGVVCVRLAGLSLRTLDVDAGSAEEESSTEGPSISYGQRAWQPQALTATPVDAAQVSRSIVFLAQPTPDLSYARQLSEGLGAQVEVLMLRSADGVATALEQALQTMLRSLQQVMTERHEVTFCLVLPDDEAGRLFTPLTALLQVALQESSRLRGRMLIVSGLAELSAVALAERVQAEICANGSMLEVRYSAEGQRELGTLMPLSLSAAPAPIFRAGGVYWLTGGLGGLGRLIAEAAADLPGVVLVLSGRSPAQGRDAALRERDVVLDYLVADVASPGDTQRAVDEILRRHGRLDGVLHAAGVLQDALIVNKTPQQVSAVFAPKVHGLVNIDAATRAITLDFLLLFSSVAAIDPSAGQADYAVANRFLDAYSAYRETLVRAGRAHGTTIAINWPLWADGGMRMDSANIEAMRRRTGIEPLPTDAGLSALAAIAASGRNGHVAVRYGHEKRNPAPTLLTTQAEDVSSQASVSATMVAPSASKAPAPSLMNETLTLLRQTLGKVLKLDPTKIRTSEKFEQYGFDSIMAVEMTLQLEELLGSLPKTLFFEYVDLQGVADYLLVEHAQSLAAALAARRPAMVTAGDPAPAGRFRESYTVNPPSTSTAQPSASPADTNYHDIAVIGLAGRYPHADTMDQLWNVLKSGQHCFEPIPSERWEHLGIYHNERDVLGKSTIQNGSFLTDIDKFDPRYFNISQRDAELMSPEVRLFLQVGVEAFEDAGYSRELMHKLYEGDVGVLVGTMSNHYNLLGFQNMLTRGARASGSYTGTLPNMLSYFYGFTGPSIFLDTMCSASSTCIDQGVHMLRSRQCRMVLAGGANLLLHPHNLISSSQEHFTSKTSELIRSFGLGADGTILGEGVGAVLLKPLVEAIADGDHIYGVIKGTAINNAGVRNGFTVPSPTMQAKAVEKALRDAAVDARTISYVEGHGSGTKLGDPIEIKALTQAYRGYTADRQFCPIGSVKSNIAHLLAAAGVAGLTKVLLQLKHATLVPSLHSEELNPAIPFAESPFYVQRELAEWRPPTIVDAHGIATTHPRRAGVTSIGAGGMNAHMIVEEYVVTERPHWPIAPRLVVLSAMTSLLMQDYLRHLEAHLRREPGLDLACIAYTLQVGRNALPCRFAVVISSTEELLTVIGEFLQGRVVTGTLFVENILAVDQAADPETVERDLAAADLPQLAHHWTQGAHIDWHALWPPQPPHKLALPTCPFEKVRCWYELYPDAPTLHNPLSSQRKLHPFIGRNLSNLSSVAYNTDVRLDDLLDYAYLHDGKRQIVPTFLLDTAWALAVIAGIASPFTLRKLQMQSGLDWSEIEKLHFSVTTRATGVHEVRLVQEGALSARRPLGFFELHETATPQSPTRIVDFATASRPVNGATFYTRLREGGLDYKPYLESVLQLAWTDAGYCLASLQEPALKQHHRAAGVCLPPSVLGALQQVAHYLAQQHGQADWAGLSLSSVDELSFDGGTVRHLLFRGQSGDIDLLDEAGRVVGVLRGARFGAAASGMQMRALDLPTISSAAVPSVTSRGTPAQAVTSVMAALAIPSPEEEAALIRAEAVTRILNRMAPILKFAPDEINVRTPFHNLGFDSISLIELASAIGTDIGVSLTPAVFFEVENVEQLTRHLMTHHGSKLHALWKLGQSTRVHAPVTADVNPPARATSQTLRPLGDALSDTAVAIIGAAARLPGADDLEAFWRNLSEGRDSIASLPMSRYTGAYARLMQAADFPHRAGVLSNVDRFDAAFFNISPAEAQLMDPQHRIFLETAWSAVEHAGYRASRLPASTGVYVGVSATDYATLLTANGVPTDSYTATGTAHSMLANRVSFFLDIHGPSQAIDTACSSSLVALHRAVESIRSGQCEMVIAGGVNLTLSADTFVGAYKAGMLSPEGQCKTFSARADGYVRGEGVAALLLKPLRQAERDGDAILGVILGSAENHGGRANSLTAPNARAQADLIMQAMRGIDPSSIGYVEAHGTGTNLGDPVEINGLKLAYAQLQANEGGAPLAPGNCAIGSVKSNIGHLESAAGVAGVLKVLLAMQHGALPANLHCEPINPYIELEGSPFSIVRDHTLWPRLTDATGRTLPRRAGVSSFGFGGANAHMVLEEYVADAPAQPLNPGPYAIVLSARTEAQLRDAARRLLAWVQERRHEPGLIERIAYTLQVGREPMTERLAFKVASMTELAALLSDYLDGYSEGVLRGSAPRGAEAPQATTAGRALHKSLQEWVGGAEVDWTPCYAVLPQRVALPTYPFARSRHWIPAQDQKLDDATLSKMLDDVLTDAVSVDEAMDVLAAHGYAE
ncbi:SDR family NAD(P)-dependent oxidoreductase (plasmid) [Robbsia andropogonis]|uniref:SDR family NAD(P)-dependent oxidoreductase n=1 Tax=Robbsia andropogonis TaxID=28092 RepID=UPI003D1C52C6